MFEIWKFVDKIGPSIDIHNSPSKAFRTRMFSFTLLFILVFTTFLSIASLIFSLQVQLLITNALGIICLTFLGLNRKYDISDWLIAALCTFFLFLATKRTIDGGAYINSISTWFVLVPLLVTIVARKKWGAITAFFTVVAVLLVDYYLSSSGLRLADNLNFENYRKLRTTHLIALSLFIYVFCSMVMSNYRELENNLMRVKSSVIDRSKSILITKISAGVSHEINNPLCAIRFSNEIIKMSLEKGDIDKDRLLKLVDKIENNVTKAALVVDALKDLSDESEKCSFEYVEKENIIAETQAVLNRELLKHNIMLKINDEDFSEDKIFCDKNKIVEILVHLINNSIYEINKSNVVKEIELNVFRKKNSFIFEIVDFAGGIDKNIESKMFDPFFTTKDVNEGMGLGLTISSYIAKKHSGDISYFKNSNSSHFRLTLPVV